MADPLAVELVAADRLRFDFSHPKALTGEDLHQLFLAVAADAGKADDLAEDRSATRVGGMAAVYVALDLAGNEVAVKFSSCFVPIRGG